MIKLSCASLSFDGFEDRNFAKTFELAPQAGIKYIEFNCWYPSSLTFLKARELKERCIRHNIVPSVIHIGSFGGTDFREITKDVCHKIRGLEFAKELGCKRLSATAAPRGEKGGLEAIITCLKEIMPVAEELDVLVCVENHANSNLENLDDYQRVFEAVSSNKLGICMDTGHFDAAGVNMDRLMEMFHPQIKHIHLKENKEKGKECFVRFGEGTTNNAHVLERMISFHYEGYVSIELCLNENNTRPLCLADVLKAVDMFKKYERD